MLIQSWRCHSLWPYQMELWKNHTKLKLYWGMSLMFVSTSSVVRGQASGRGKLGQQNAKSCWNCSMKFWQLAHVDCFDAHGYFWHIINTSYSLVWIYICLSERLVAKLGFVHACTCFHEFGTFWLYILGKGYLMAPKLQFSYMNSNQLWVSIKFTIKFVRELYFT